MTKIFRLLQILRRGLAERHIKTLLPIFRIQEGKLVLVKLYSFFEIFMSNIIQIIVAHTNKEIGRQTENTSSEWYKSPTDDIEVK